MAVSEQTVLAALQRWVDATDALPPSEIDDRAVVLGDHACQQLLHLVQRPQQGRRLRPPLAVPSQWLPPL